MVTKEEKQKMRKRNMKLFPTYKMLSWDFLFFYAIDFLFLTQIKNIDASDVVLKSTFNAFFGIILQIPANIIVEILGRKNSLILGNVLNSIYIFILILSRNLYDLIIAEFFCALAFALKNIVETSILSESIPPSKYKSKIFSNINSKGASRYYVLSTISKVIAGGLFEINGYLPIIFSFITVAISVIMSLFFIEPIKKKQKKDITSNEFKEIKQGISFVLKSERLKALIVAYALISAFLSILSNYNVSLLEDIGISSVTIGVVSAMMSFVRALASKRERKFHDKFKNKSIITISLILSISCIICGICSIEARTNYLLLGIIIVALLGCGFSEGMYYTIRDKYLGNFSNKKIDTKIYTVNQLFGNISKVIAGIIASFLLDKMNTAYCMITIGIMFTIIYLLTEKYMKTRVGLKPEEYSKEERKYDELKETE